MSVAMDLGFLLSTLKCVHILYPVVVFHSLGSEESLVLGVQDPRLPG